MPPSLIATEVTPQAGHPAKSLSSLPALRSLSGDSQGHNFGVAPFSFHCMLVSRASWASPLPTYPWGPVWPQAPQAHSIPYSSSAPRIYLQQVKPLCLGPLMATKDLTGQKTHSAYMAPRVSLVHSPLCPASFCSSCQPSLLTAPSPRLAGGFDSSVTNDHSTLCFPSVHLLTTPHLTCSQDSNFKFQHGGLWWAQCMS